MIYRSKFEDKRQQVLSLCNKMRGNEDKAIVKSLYSLANFQNKFGDQAEARISHTEYSELNNNDLMKLFLKDKFANLGDNKLTNLFQELHNRATVKNDNDPRYVVSVAKIEDGVMGYMEPYSNVLNISKNMINRFKNNQSNNVRGNNATTVGPMFANVLLHETQHTCQMENIIKYAIGDITNQEDKARACMSLMKLVVEDIAYDTQDANLISYIDKNYWFDFDEHDANMYPMYYIKDCYEKGEISEKVYAEVMHSWEEDSLGFKADWDNKGKVSKNFTERIDNMEKVANYLIDVFDKRTQDGVMKRDVMNTLKNYMKVDENNNSPFRNRLTEDFNMCAEVFYAKDRYTKPKTQTNEQTNVM